MPAKTESHHHVATLSHALPHDVASKHVYPVTPCGITAMSASIRRLPDSVVDTIKASVLLSCLNDAVCGLLKNALDAGASRIDVYLDYSRGNCSVEDNGHGISTADFKEDGGLGKLHRECASAFGHHDTSSLTMTDTSHEGPNLQVHGSRGDFLASAANLSLLSITSHQAQHVSHNSITYHQGRVIARDVPARLEQRFMRYRHGTRVVIRNLFGSMPVRVKHRSLTFSEKSDIDKELRRLIRQVVALLLAWPKEISVTLKETRAQKELRFKSPGHTETISVCASRLLTQSGLIDVLSAADLVPVSASTGGISIEGCISIKPVANRHCQMISLGVHPVYNEYGSNILYEEVNKMFLNSSFGVIDNVVEQSHNTKAAPNPRKGVERWPVYYFRLSTGRISAGSDVIDMVHDSSSETTEILQLLQAVCYGFLRKHHFRPQKPGSTAKRPRERVMGGRQGMSTELHIPSPSGPFNNWPRTKPLLDSAAEKPLATGRSYELPILSQNQSVPVSQEALDRIAALTGDGSHSSQKSRPSRVIAKFPTPQPSAWLQRIIDTWQNPTFEAAEQLVPRVGTQIMPVNNPTPYHHKNHCQDGSAQYESGTVGMSSRITRKALSSAKIIAQVDRKFILTKVSLNDVESGPTTGLFMIDQHAADERCRLEELMKDYFGPSQAAVSEPLDRPITIELSQIEAESLRRRGPYFKAWGIMYSILDEQSHTENTNSLALCRIAVSSMPPSILERCRTEPNLLVDILRHEAWSENTDVFPSVPKTLNTGDSNQLPSFHGCPKGILELLHSRSCRSKFTVITQTNQANPHLGAIMFNDALTKAECETMVNRLSHCSFPFQCAHGRPSMAPLIDLGTGNKIGGWFEDRQDASIEKWKAWMGS